MERSIDLWKILWPDGIPRDAYPKALAIAAIAMDEAQKAGRRPLLLQRGAVEATPEPLPVLVTVTEIGKRLGMTGTGITYHIRKTKKLKARKTGKGWVADRADAEAFIASFKGGSR